MDSSIGIDHRKLRINGGIRFMATRLTRILRIEHTPALLGMLLGLSLAAGGRADAASYIVEARSTQQAAAAVRRLGGHVTHELPIIDGVSAELSGPQAERLRHEPGLVVVADGRVLTSSTTTTTTAPPCATICSIGLSSTNPDVYQRNMLGVNTLASQGINGAGVTVAVLDSGILQALYPTFLTKDLNGNNRMVAQYDAIKNVLVDAAHPCLWYPCVNDDYGHGSHITSLIASSNTQDLVLKGEPQGIAPMVHLVSVKAFDGTGTGTYASVLNGLNWILANRTTYGNIRVVNMSFGARPQSFYWNDPIDQAVMKL
jgi:serine protease AprX